MLWNHQWYGENFKKILEEYAYLIKKAKRARLRRSIPVGVPWFNYLPKLPTYISIRKCGLGAIIFKVG